MAGAARARRRARRADRGAAADQRRHRATLNEPTRQGRAPRPNARAGRSAASRTAAGTSGTPAGSARRDGPRRRGPDRVVRASAARQAAVAAMGDAADEHGVDVEPEAEREHRATVAPPPAREQERGRRATRPARTRSAGRRQPVAALGLLHLAGLGELRQRRRDGRRGRGRPWSPPRRRSSPRRRRARRARRPWSRRAPSGEGSESQACSSAGPARSSSPWPSACVELAACAREACARAPSEERGSSAASALRSRSASPASWSRRSWICSRRRSITFHFLAVRGGRSYTHPVARDVRSATSPAAPSHGPPHHHTRTAAPSQRDGRQNPCPRASLGTRRAGRDHRRLLHAHPVNTDPVRAGLRLRSRNTTRPTRSARRSPRRVMQSEHAPRIVGDDGPYERARQRRRERDASGRRSRTGSPPRT